MLVLALSAGVYVAAGRIYGDRARKEAVAIGRELKAEIDSFDFVHCTGFRRPGECDGGAVGNAVQRALARHSRARLASGFGHESAQTHVVRVTRGIWHQCATIAWVARQPTSVTIESC